jgi:hypothetical protein
MARPERFELPTLCFEDGGFENLNALLSVAYGRKPFRNLSSVGLRWLHCTIHFRYPNPTALNLRLALKRTCVKESFVHSARPKVLGQTERGVNKQLSAMPLLFGHRAQHVIGVHEVEEQESCGQAVALLQKYWWARRFAY